MQNGKNRPRSVTCRTCQRTFADRASLQQHNSTKHGQTSDNQVALVQRGRPNSNRSARVNYDGTIRKPGQERDEALYGSSAKRIERYAGSTGIQEAVSAIIGSTPEGRAWALAALHPCGAGEIVGRNIGVVNGMCDTMTSSVATPVYRSENHLSYAQVLFDTAVPSPSTYGIDILVPPIPEIDFIYRLIDDSSGQKTGWIVVRLPDFQLPEPNATDANTPNSYDATDKFTTMAGIGYGKLRQIAVGHTFELDAAGLNDQGRVVVGQMEGQWRPMSLNVPSITASLQDAVNSIDFSGQTFTTNKYLTAADARGPEATSNVWFLQVPTDPGVITSTCPNAYQGLAKHGAYVVQKFTSPLLGYAFKRTGSDDVFPAGDTADEQQSGSKYWPYMPASAIAIETANASGTLNAAESFWTKDPKLPQWSAFGNGNLPVNALPENVTVSQDKLHPGVSEPSDMMTAVVMFRNLPAGGNAGVTSSVRVKSRNFYEAISNGTNPAVAPYIHPPAQFDFQALNSVIIAGKQLADGYPAAANSLSTILQKVWGAIKDYVQPSMNAIGGLDLPVVSGIARIIKSGIKLGSDAEAEWIKGRGG